MTSNGKDKAHASGEKSNDANNQEDEISQDLFETDLVIAEEIDYESVWDCPWIIVAEQENKHGIMTTVEMLLLFSCWRSLPL